MAVGFSIAGEKRAPVRPALRLLLAWALCLAAGLGARAGVAPGPLSRPHRELDGLAHCTSCHTAGGGSIRDACLACHREIGWLATRGRGVHAGDERKDCVRCHAEHRGLDSALVRFEEGTPEAFDHRKTGWTLAGKHASVKCRACHKPEFERSEAARLTKRQDHENSFLGLEKDCGACHENRHRGASVRDCTLCHDPAGWKPARAFDHSRTRYPLTGLHARTVCTKCHHASDVALPAATGAPPAVPVFEPVRHDECSACHADPHAGRLGAACARCHRTDGFREIDRKSFDHDRTRYPLRGRHAALDCVRCHDPAAPKGTHPRFDPCGSCHRDPHAGRATLAGKPADCAECHRVEGFRPSTYTAARHRASLFPLEGKHVDLACDRCHTRAGGPDGPLPLLADARVSMRPPHAGCASCHADAHGGQLALRPDHGECGSCHRVDGWKPSTFTAKEHASLRTALEGKHAALSCASCHALDRKGLPPPMPLEALGKAKVALSLGGAACESCHAGPHGPQFAERRDRGACESCHDTYSFVPASRFSHDRSTRFPLLRAHFGLPCARCHAKKPDAAGKIVTVFRPTPSACKDCHAPKRTAAASLLDGGAREPRADLGLAGDAARADHLLVDHEPRRG
jgi:hypothetical protein